MDGRTLDRSSYDAYRICRPRNNNTYFDVLMSHILLFYCYEQLKTGLPVGAEAVHW